jgi:UDP-glucose 4,6-dehydratase
VRAVYAAAPTRISLARRYYICDKKLTALGWVEKTSWEEGLKKTIDWYLEHGFESRWVGDVERALAAHPKAQ